jgi:hypothetical protein
MDTAEDTGNRPDETLSDHINQLSDTIGACDRLLLLGARTVVECTAPITGQAEPAVTFIPSVSRDLQNAVSDLDRHPTTSALCIAALQHLLPIVNRFEFGAHESKDLAFHPIDKRSFEVFKPDRLRTKIRDTIDAGLEALQGDGIATDKNGPVSLTSGTFGYLHPLTAARILQATAPSKGLFGTVWWRSLFAVLWFLNRRTGSSVGYPNIQETDSPGTAFLTSKCIDAIETVYAVFERRRRRFQRLRELMDDLRSARDKEKRLHQIDQELISHDIFCKGYTFKQRNLIEDIRACIRDIALDTGVHGLYQDWKKNLDGRFDKRDKSKPEQGPNFLLEVIDSFVDAVKNANEQRNDAVRFASESMATITSASKDVGKIHRIIREKLGKEHGSKLRSLALEKLPGWICSEDYWTSTRKALTDEKPSWGSEGLTQTVLGKLENHWLRHRNACESAQRTTAEFSGYFTGVFETFDTAVKSIENNRALRMADGDVEINAFLSSLDNAANQLAKVHQQLWKDIDTGVRWAEVLMNRHLAYAASGGMTRFDPCELAHAVRVASRDGGKIRFGIILQALRSVCASQRADGTWSSQQPFYWTGMGSSASTLSVETAAAVVATVNELLRNPERFGASLDEVTEKLESVFTALDRFFQSLSGSIQSIRIPPAFGARLKVNADTEPPFYGWCSDRIFEPGRLHSWATAISIEFLVSFRSLLQERINCRLRTEFLSHHPAELAALSQVEPTDLANLDAEDDKQPVSMRLLRFLRDHKLLELTEGPWLPSPPPADPSISFWSGVLFGPPGTSKTFLAKAIAGELNWPLISLSPSDFLARGGQQIEARAQEIFSALRAGSRLVYFFDEIDELIRDRGQPGDEQRSLFSFLTPSFLTKFQDLRDQAKKKEFIFIMGTNYFDRIDSAAKRSGRFDQSFLIVYPDLQSRGYVIMQHILKELDATKQKERCEFIGSYAPRPELKLEPKALLGYLTELQKASEARAKDKEKGGRKAKFIDVLANFTGFLSYTKIQELNKLMTKVTLSDEKEFRQQSDKYVEYVSKGVNRVAGELHNFHRGRSDQFKPEINFVEYYSGRSGAMDEIVGVAMLLPTELFPWRDSGDGPSQFEIGAAISGLIDAYRDAENPKFEAELRKRHELQDVLPPQ